MPMMLCTEWPSQPPERWTVISDGATRHPADDRELAQHPFHTLPGVLKLLWEEDLSLAVSRSSAGHVIRSTV